MPRLYQLLLVAVVACSGSPKSAEPPHESSAKPAHEKVLVNIDDHGLALGGHDAIAYTTDNAPVRGSDQFTSQHTGATYLFASAEHKQTFDGDPAGRSPRYGGFCAYAASQNRLTPGDPKVWRIHEGKLLLFANDNFRELYDKDPTGTLRKADENWPGLVAQHGRAP